MEHQIKEFDSLIDLLEDLQKREATSIEISAAMERFVEQKARVKGVPIHGMFELTPLCNLDCKMCYVHLSAEQLKGQSVGILSGEQWISLMHQAIDAGMMYATLTGGECLTYPFFDDVYLFLQSSGVKTSILTNGILLDSERIQFFKKYQVNSIQVSLYGTNNDVYENVTGCRAFENVISNIKLAREVGLPVKLAITPNRFMGSDDEKLIEFAINEGIPFSVNSGLHSARQETGRNLSEYDQSIEEYIRLRKVYMKQRGIVIPDRCDEASALKLPEKGIQCGGGNSGFSIDWRGDMYACTMLKDIKAEPLKYGFSAAWNVVHEAAKEYPNPIECNSCKFSAICSKCVAAHRDGAEPGHANPRICSLAKMIREVN